MKRLIKAGMPALAALALSACGTTTTTVTPEDPKDEGPKAECKVDADCKEDFRCLQDEETGLGKCVFDDRIVQQEELEAPTYVEGIDKKAQDAFRQGVQAALEVPPRYDDAMAKFEEAIELDKSFLEAYFNIAMVHERMRRSDEALATYQRALKANPNSDDAKAFIGKIYLANAKKALFLGRDAEAEQLMTKAKAIFDEVLARDFENVPANNAMALYWLLRGKADKAEEHVKQVLILEPQDVTALNTRGLIFLQEGKLSFAEWVFAQKVLSLDPNSIEAHTNLGAVYVQQNKLPLAVKHFKRSVDLDPSNAEARMNLGAIYIDFLNYPGAREQFEAVLKLQPDNVEAVIGLASAKLGMGEFEEAIAGYEKAIELDKRRAILLERVGKLYEKQGQKADIIKAIEYYERWVAMTNPPADHPTVRKIPVLKEMLAMGMLDQQPQPKTPEGEGGEGEAAPEGTEDTDETAEGAEDDAAAGDTDGGKAEGDTEPAPAPETPAPVVQPEPAEPAAAPVEPEPAEAAPEGEPQT